MALVFIAIGYCYCRE